MATAQLQITPTGTPSAAQEWKLDRRTIEIGRAGLAQAREALSKANPIELIPEPVEAQARPLFTTGAGDRSQTARNRRAARAQRVSEGQGALFPPDDRLAA